MDTASLVHCFIFALAQRLSFFQTYYEAASGIPKLNQTLSST
jgi:hypothetical protein